MEIKSRIYFADENIKKRCYGAILEGMASAYWTSIREGSAYRCWTPIGNRQPESQALFGVQMKEREKLERTARLNTVSAYCGDNVALCRVLGRYMMYVDTRDVSLAPHMMLNGFWESWITVATSQYLKPGMVCADVGACAGYYTLIMADKVGPSGHVYCFEPNPRSMQLIKRTLDVNGFYDRVTFVQKAVSDVNGKARFCMNAEHPPGGTIMGDPMTAAYEDEKMQEKIVETVRLDDAIDRPVDFMKMDIEGAELQALDGMKELRKRSPNLTLCVEHAPALHSENPTALPDKLRELGAKLLEVNSDGNIVSFDGQTDDEEPESRFHLHMHMLWAKWG